MEVVKQTYLKNNDILYEQIFLCRLNIGNASLNKSCLTWHSIRSLITMFIRGFNYQHDFERLGSWFMKYEKEL